MRSGEEQLGFVFLVVLVSVIGTLVLLAAGIWWAMVRLGAPVWAAPALCVALLGWIAYALSKLC